MSQPLPPPSPLQPKRQSDTYDLGPPPLVPPPMPAQTLAYATPRMNMARGGYGLTRLLDAGFEMFDPVQATQPGARLVVRDGALIYLSLGSLGSADVVLMQRLVDLLATTEHRIIVSKGPLADQITLHDNQIGEGFMPQPAILPQADLVITHGGNNTVTEAFHHGKPMIVLPLFWDQVDNAQRVEETGFGRRLATYDFRDEELTDAIDELLANRALHSRLAAVSARLQANPGTVLAADLIEQVARTGAPVPRST